MTTRGFVFCNYCNSYKTKTIPITTEQNDLIVEMQTDLTVHEDDW